MSLPPLQLRPISTSHYYVSGNVTIHDGAAIAPGVLIQADPDGCVIIKSGACIGVGSVLHAHQGTVEVGEGANIGAEVLLVGQVTIGAHACIGTASTILNSSIELGRVIPPGSLIGDTSRQPEELKVTDTVVYPPAPNGQSVQQSVVTAAEPSQPEETRPVESSGMNVYGQVYVNQMLVKMFPHSQRAKDSNPQSDKPALSGDDPWDD